MKKTFGSVLDADNCVCHDLCDSPGECTANRLIRYAVLGGEATPELRRISRLYHSGFHRDTSLDLHLAQRAARMLSPSAADKASLKASVLSEEESILSGAYRALAHHTSRNFSAHWTLKSDELSGSMQLVAATQVPQNGQEAVALLAFSSFGILRESPELSGAASLISGYFPDSQFGQAFLKVVTAAVGSGDFVSTVVYLMAADSLGLKMNPKVLDALLRGADSGKEGVLRTAVPILTNVPGISSNLSAMFSDWMAEGMRELAIKILNGRYGITDTVMLESALSAIAKGVPASQVVEALIGD